MIAALLLLELRLLLLLLLEQVLVLQRRERSGRHGNGQPTALILRGR